ncbi:MAG: hypothetical protein EPN97_15210 [Alphaproteobacteria bacterium]|nr:MAG: hypothetical protein EPN97_15210 [Alphaproteobacteria bacterium]
MIRIFLFMAMMACAVSAYAADPPAAAGDKPFTDAPPPPPPPPAPKETMRNDKPMDDNTKYYMRKEFTTKGREGSPRHEMTYFWRQPKEIESGKTYPLVVVLHDEKGLAQAGTYLLDKDLLASNPSFLVVPTLPFKKMWAFPAKIPEDPTLEKYAALPQGLPDVVELVEDLANNFPVDLNRIYVVGCGDGGFGAFGAVRQYPKVFAAAIPLAGGWSQTETPKMTKVPIYALHGEEDKTYAIGLSRNVAYYIQKFKGDVHHLGIQGLGHDCNDTRFYNKALWKWMYSQHKPETK